MSFALLFYLSLIATSVLASGALPGLPDKIYGVNLGSWLLIESWMLPDEWVQMGGEICSDCSTCIATEFAFAKAYPDTVDAKFGEHWETWFTQDHVDQLADAGINTNHRILPQRRNVAQRGLSQLKTAGIAVILDHHALPGVATPNQMFAGRCTTDVQFYTPPNFHRALVWTAVMTALSHLDLNFSTVAALEAINEPIMNATQTPGLGDFEKNFVQTLRAIEYSLGIPNSFPGPDPAPANTGTSTNVTEAIATTATLSSIPSEVRQVLQDTIPIIVQLASELDINLDFNQNGLRSYLSTRGLLVTNFMEIHWQFESPTNPSDAAIGPQAYDSHLYYSFGGIADPNEQAYLTSVCNLGTIQADAAIGNSPLWFGEWGLSTQFSASDDFLKKWADAQKLSYGKDAGWIFCNFRIEDSSTAAATARQWSYLEGLRLGYLTQDPSQFNDPHVCDPYISTST